LNDATLETTALIGCIYSDQVPYVWQIGKSQLFFDAMCGVSGFYEWTHKFIPLGISYV